MDPLVYNMSHEDPGTVSYSEIGGLSEQIRELREVRKKMAKCQHQLMKYTVVQKFVIIRVFLEKKKSYANKGCIYFIKIQENHNIVKYYNLI